MSKPLNNLTRQQLAEAIDAATVNGRPAALVRIIKGLPASAWEEALRCHPNHFGRALVHAAFVKIEANEIRQNTLRFTARITGSES